MDRKQKRLLFVSAAALLVLFLLSLLSGPAGLINPADPAKRSILLNLRLPRAIGAILAGCGLSLSGAIVQKVFHNSLASANLIGINASVGFFSLLAGVIFPLSFTAGTVFGFLGGMLCAGLIMALVWRKKASRLTVLLAGMAISQLFSAGIDLLTILAPDLLSGYASFRIGSLASLTLSKDGMSALLICSAAFLTFLFSDELELFALGDRQAQALGLSVRKWTILFLALASLMACGVVSLCGMLGFVGLIVPAWLSRFGFFMKSYLAACLLLGAALVLAADLAGRLIVLPWELPAGLILSLIGGPYFLVLLLERSRHGA